MKKINPKSRRLVRGCYWFYSASVLRGAASFNGSPSGQSSFIGARISLRFTRGKK